MPIIAANCPRCRAQDMTFDVNGYNNLGVGVLPKNHGILRRYELFAVCKKCKGATTFCVIEHNEIARDIFTNPENVMNITDSLNRYFKIYDFIRLREDAPQPPPEFIPDNIRAVFEEGATSLSTKCWNAAGGMFRLCLDLTTKDMISKEKPEVLSKDVKNKLAPRIDWLFKEKKLPEDLKDIANIIRQDGNDGAHDGTLEEYDALNLLEFTVELLEDIYKKKKKKEIANKRTQDRRAKHAKPAPAKLIPVVPQKPQKTQ